jgi:hypothetical protein
LRVPWQRCQARRAKEPDYWHRGLLRACGSGHTTAPPAITLTNPRRLMPLAEAQEAAIQTSTL